MLIVSVLSVALSAMQVLGEPTGKTRVEIVHHGDDSAGEQLAYLMRDRFRASASFQVTGEDPSYRIVVTTMDTSRITVGPSTTYAVVITASQASSGFGYPEAYITSAVYSCPSSQLFQCSETVYIEAGTEIELAAREYRDAANEDIDRMYREVIPSTD